MGPLIMKHEFARSVLRHLCRSWIVLGIVLCQGGGGFARANDDERSAALEQMRDRQESQAVIERPLLTGADAETYKKNKTLFMQINRRGAADREEQQIVRAVLRYKIFIMAEPEEISAAAAHRKKVETDLRNAGFRINNANAKKKYRDFVNGEVVALCEQLLDNHAYVRLQAVALIAGLDSVVEKGSPVVPFVDVYAVLLGVAQDQKQLPQTRIYAVNGLRRILKHGKLSVSVQAAIASALAQELQRGNLAVDWFDERLCDTLSAVQTPQPAVVAALLATLQDQNRTWRVRSGAARALGRVGLPGGTSVDEIALNMADLAAQMGRAQQKSPGNPMWAAWFWNVYLGFHHQNAEERAERAGLLNKAPSATVRQAYERVLPLVKDVVANSGNGTTKKIHAVLIDPLVEWLGKSGRSDSGRSSAFTARTEG